MSIIFLEGMPHLVYKLTIHQPLNALNLLCARVLEKWWTDLKMLNQNYVSL